MLLPSKAKRLNEARSGEQNTFLTFHISFRKRQFCLPEIMLSAAEVKSLIMKEREKERGFKRAKWENPCEILISANCSTCSRRTRGFALIAVSRARRWHFTRKRGCSQSRHQGRMRVLHDIGKVSLASFRTCRSCCSRGPSFKHNIDYRDRCGCSQLLPETKRHH